MFVLTPTPAPAPREPIEGEPLVRLHALIDLYDSSNNFIPAGQQFSEPAHRASHLTAAQIATEVSP